MKKVLFASTALVLAAGVASAEVSLSGEASMGLKYNGATEETTVHNSIEFYLSGSVATDSGVTVGASTDFGDTAATNAPGGDYDGVLNDAEVWISYNGLELRVGNIGEASDQGGLSDVGYDGVGVDNVVELGGFGDHDVVVSYSFGDISAAASFDSESDNWGIGANGSVDAFTWAVGFGETDGEDIATVTLGYSAGAFGAKIYYLDNAAGQGMGIEGSYTSGDVTVTGVFVEGTDDTDAYGVGVSYDLGGATLSGGIAEINDETFADLGVSFSF